MEGGREGGVKNEGRGRGKEGVTENLRKMVNGCVKEEGSDLEIEKQGE